MKTIKKYFKAILLFMAFAVCSVVFAFNPSLTTYAAMSYTYAGYNQVINSIKMPKTTVDAQDEFFEVPLLSAGYFGGEVTSYKVLVTDPAGQQHWYDSSEATHDEYFDTTSNSGFLRIEKLVNGVYRIQYVITDGDSQKFYSNPYLVNVTNVPYELDFTIIEEGATQGQRVLIPGQVKEDSSAIALPVARVKEVDSDEDGEIVKPVVYRNGAPLGEAKASADEGDFYIADGVYYVNPTMEGKYTVEYSSNKGSNRPTKTYTIVVHASDSDFVAPTSDDIKIDDFKVPSIELGKKGIVLNKLVVNNNLEKNVDYNITEVVISKISNPEIKKVLTAKDNLTFDMTVEAFGVESYNDLVGEYDITYTIVDAYGNSKTISNNKEKQAVKVTDSSAPQVYMAYSYDLDNEGNPVKDSEGNDVVNTNYAIELRNTYGYAEIVLPAIYAKDFVTEYKDLKMYRYLRSVKDGTTKYYYLDNVDLDGNTLTEEDDGYNFAQSYLATGETDNTGIGKLNQAVTFRFAKSGSEVDESTFAGEYTLGYFVVSEGDDDFSEQRNYLYSSGSTQYKINVAETANHTSTETPTVTIDNLNNVTTKKSDETIKLTISASDKDDSRLKNVAFYYYGDLTDSLKADIEAAIAAVKNDTESDAYKLKCSVLDDSTFAMASSYTGFKLISNGGINDSSFEFKFENYNNQEKAIVGVISMNNDNSIEIATKTVTIRSVNDTDGSAELNIIKGGSFAVTTENEGVITETGVIENGRVYKQGDDVTLPTIEFLDQDKELQLGVTYYIDNQIVNNKVNYLGSLNPYTTTNDSGNREINGGTIKTSAVGTYYVVYTATDIAGNQTVVYFTFEVEDSSAPELIVNAEGEDLKISGNTIKANLGVLGTTIDFEQILKQSGNDVTGNTGAVINPIKVDTKGEALRFKDTGKSYTFYDAGIYYLTFSGEYKGEYADDKLIVVEILEPTLAWVDEDYFDVPTTATFNQVVELPYLIASYGVEQVDVSVKVEGPDGKEMTVSVDESGDYPVWSFTTYDEDHDKCKGDYKVTYTATSNEGKISKEFTVKVGDNVAPTIKVANQKTLEQELVYEGTDITYTIEKSTSVSNRKLVITVKKGDKEIYSCNTGLTITDIDDINSTPQDMSWSGLDVKLTGSNVTGGTKTYKITGKGECTLTIKISDKYNNEQVKTIKFKVVEKASDDSNENNALGIVLIVISVVILVGVIAFFLFTGKDGNKKGKNKTKNSVKKEVTTDTKEVEKTEEVTETEKTEEAEEKTEESSFDTEAKTGEVE